MKIGKNTRVNFGKAGVGLSFGAKGLRRTLHSGGRKTTSAGIPGSGLYYTKSSSKKAGSRGTNTSQSKQQRVEENQAAVDTFNEYIQMITVAFEREIMNQLNYENVHQADAMQNFNHHMKHLKPAGFKADEKI